MILACHNIEKAFGEEVIVRDGSFHIEDHEKAALVGINGAGKSTILKMIVGELPADSGSVTLAKGRTLGYLAQHQDLTGGNTIYEEVKTAKARIISIESEIRQIERDLPTLQGEALTERLNTYHRLTEQFERENGYAYESEITGVLKGLGFGEEDFTKAVDTLSGGQKTRVSLGKLLLTRPDVLLLDEPTNHLDLNSISWLETYLLNYPGAVLKGLPHPSAKRSVEGDLGMRWNARTIVSLLGDELFCDLAGVTEKELHDTLDVFDQTPDILPQNEAMERIDVQLAKQAAKNACERHAGSLEVVFTPIGERYMQSGKDLSDVKWLIGTGGPVITSKDPAAILSEAGYSDQEPLSLRPRHAKCLLDHKYILSAMGLLSQRLPDVALKIMKNELTEL